MEDLSLKKLDAVRVALEQATTVQEVTHVLNMAKAAQVYAQQAKRGKEVQLQIREYIARAECRLGEMVGTGKATGQIKRGGSGSNQYGNVEHDDNSKTTLADLGISRDLSSRAQKLAAIPKDEFERRIAEQKANGTLSVKKILGAKHGNENGTHTPKARNPVKPRRAPKEHPDAPVVIDLSDRGLSDTQIAAQTGLSKWVVRNTIEEEAIRREEREKASQVKITPEMLKKSDRDKVVLAIRQLEEELRRKYEKEFHERVRSYLEDWSKKTQEQLNRSERIIRHRMGIMSKTVYKKILSCLHPDWVTDEKQKARYEEAFHEFHKLEVFLLSEKDSPITFVSTLPKTMAEWEEAKRQATAARKASRATKKAAKNNQQMAKRN